MSLCKEGMKKAIRGGQVTVEVADSHPLLVLANQIHWI